MKLDSKDRIFFMDKYVTSYNRAVYVIDTLEQIRQRMDPYDNQCIMWDISSLQEEVAG